MLLNTEVHRRNAKWSSSVRRTVQQAFRNQWSWFVLAACVAPLSARYPLKLESEPNLGNSQNQMIIGHELGGGLKSPTHSLVRSLTARHTADDTGISGAGPESSKGVVLVQRHPVATLPAPPVPPPPRGKGCKDQALWQDTHGSTSSRRTGEEGYLNTCHTLAAHDIERQTHDIRANQPSQPARSLRTGGRTD